MARRNEPEISSNISITEGRLEKIYERLEAHDYVILVQQVQPEEGEPYPQRFLTYQGGGGGGEA